jgi:hypothetical protein
MAAPEAQTATRPAAPFAGAVCWCRGLFSVAVLQSAPALTLALVRKLAQAVENERTAAVRLADARHRRTVLIALIEREAVRIMVLNVTEPRIHRSHGHPHRHQRPKNATAAAFLIVFIVCLPLVGPTMSRARRCEPRSSDQFLFAPMSSSTCSIARLNASTGAAPFKTVTI